MSLPYPNHFLRSGDLTQVRGPARNVKRRVICCRREKQRSALNSRPQLWPIIRMLRAVRSVNFVSASTFFATRTILPVKITHCCILPAE